VRGHDRRCGPNSEAGAGPRRKLGWRFVEPLLPHRNADYGHEGAGKSEAQALPGHLFVFCESTTSFPDSFFWVSDHRNRPWRTCVCGRPRRGLFLPTALRGTRGLPTSVAVAERAASMADDKRGLRGKKLLRDPRSIAVLARARTREFPPTEGASMTRTRSIKFSPAPRGTADRGWRRLRRQ